MRIWQVDCVCGVPVPVAMHQCGSDVICPHCKSPFHVPSSLDLNDWPSSIDSSGFVASHSGELIRVNSTEKGNELRKHLLSSENFRWISSQFFQQQLIVSAVAMSLAEGLTESQARKILEDALTAMKAGSIPSAEQIMSLAIAAKKDEAGMWLKRLLFKPFSSGWLGRIHILFTLLLGWVIAIQLMDTFQGQEGRHDAGLNRGSLIVVFTAVVTVCFFYFFWMGRLLFKLLHRKTT